MTLDIGDALKSVELRALGLRIRNLRTERGMTQGQVGGDDLSIAYVSRIESGGRRPNVSMLRVVATRLDTTLEYLLTGVEPQRVREQQLVVRYAELALETGEPIDAERVARQLIEEAPDPHSNGVVNDARYLLGRALEAQGRLDEAIAVLSRYQTEAPGHPRWITATIALSRCYREAGDLNRAIDVAERASGPLEEQGLDGLAESVQLTLTLAAAYIERGDHAHALLLCEQVAERAEELRSPTLRAYAYWNASAAESERGRHGNALDLANRALGLLSEGEDARNLARLRLQVGVTMLRSGDTDPRQAEKHLRRAKRELSRTSGSAVDLGRCDVYLAQAKLDQGDLDGAERLAGGAADSVGDVAPGVAADAHLVLGRAAAVRGERALVRRHYQAAAAALTAGEADRSAAQAWYELGVLLDESGDHTAARDAFRSAGAASGLTAPTRSRAAARRG